MAINLGIYVFTIAVQYMFRKKAKHTELAEGWEQLDFPEADLGSPIPVIFGTRWVKNANVVWYGDLKTQPVRVKSGGKK